MEKDSSNQPHRTVFYDARGKRWRIVSRVWLALTLAVTVLFVVFAVSMLFNPFLPQIPLKANAAAHEQQQQAKPVGDPPIVVKTERDTTTKQLIKQVKAEKSARQAKEKAEAENARAVLKNKPAPTLEVNTGRPLAIGFYVNWDDSSYASLKNNISELDWLVPEWIRLSDDGASPIVFDLDPLTQKAIDLIRKEKPAMPILPLVQNYKNEQWDSGMLAKAVATEEARRNLINSLLKVVDDNKFGGVTIDLEEVPASAQKNLFTFMQEMHDEFQKRGLIVAQAVPFDNSDWDYRAYAGVTDYLMLMAYDQHWSSGQPGAIAAQDWFDETLKKRMTELSPSKTIICIGNYGYDWTSGTKEAEDVTFQQAMLTARDSLDSPAGIKFDAQIQNPHFSYTEDDGKTHNLWFLDAVTAYNQIKSSGQYKPAGFALWRMGSEDPSLWKIFGASKNLETESLKTIIYGYDVDFEGTGEILQVVAEPQDGSREIKTDSENFISSEIYKTIPSSYVIQRTGDHPGLIALTFDDGPDATWTPQILDILKEKDVKASFFIVGENGETNPSLVKRIVNEGHDLGNHSYTHPNLGEVPTQVVDLELTATQRLIESLTGRSTRLFRAPYFGDAEPRTPDEVEPTAQAQRLGYISVGLHIDPDDWKLYDDKTGARRTVDELVQLTLDGAAVKTTEERGQIVLLHDAGGDRSATVAALPLIIDDLRARGYKFVTVSQLAGLSHDQAMPLVPQDKALLTDANSMAFYLLSMGGWLIKLLFIVGIVLGLARVAIIGTLAFAQFLRSRRREETHFGENFQPLVTVVVPAYNEAKVIDRTINSLLASDYENFEIIVVDDGSTDATASVVREKFGSYPQVTLFTKENDGKAAALNYGWQKGRGEIIVALDADTIFTTTTVGSLVKRFADANIGAVAGNAKVGNRLNIVTKWQALEYVTSQNFDRRAFSSLNCITVVPGSVGAWRRLVLEETGGFSSDTLAEDQDLTIQVRKLGYKIGYEEDAIGLTEAPDSLGGLAKQRFRWSYGTLQCMWKHKTALLNPRHGTLGFVAMPNVWIFQVFFPLVSPIMDLMFIWTFISAAIGYLEHQQEYSPTNLYAVIFYYALFMVVDYLGAYFAFLMERRESKKLLGWLLIQRFGYRQVMYWVMVKSVLTAIRGAIVGWGKLERKATVGVAGN